MNNTLPSVQDEIPDKKKCINFLISTVCLEMTDNLFLKTILLFMATLHFME